jgi:hypothetical protein
MITSYVVLRFSVSHLFAPEHYNKQSGISGRSCLIPLPYQTACNGEHTRQGSLGGQVLFQMRKDAVALADSVILQGLQDAVSGEKL